MKKTKAARKPRTAKPPKGEALVADRRRAVPRLIELRRVAAEVLPEILNGNRFDMTAWLHPLGPDENDIFDQAMRSGAVGPIKECDTVGCLGGWGELLSEKLAPARDADLCEFYGLTRAGEEYLFYCFSHARVGIPGLEHAVRRLDVVLAEAREEAQQ